MRIQLRLVGIALGLLFGLAAGCGGSSSETPPPERPDSWQLALRKPKANGHANEEPRHSSVNYGRYARPAKSTWGSGRARRANVSADAGAHAEQAEPETE